MRAVKDSTEACPFAVATFPDMCLQMPRHQLAEADHDKDIVRGWKKADVKLRERVGRLVLDGNDIAKIVEGNSLQRPTLVRGDFG